MKIKVSQLFAITRLVQDMQKQQKAGKISSVDTDLFLAEQEIGLDVTFKYFDLAGGEKMARILIPEGIKPLNKGLDVSASL